MVRMESAAQIAAAVCAASAGHECEDDALPGAEAAPHRCTQYSVSRISVVGKFAGGVSRACALTRLTAAA